MVTDKTITHELKEGRLGLTIAANGPALSAAFELKPSGEMFEATLSDTQIRGLCHLFASAPQLIAAAVKSPPGIAIDPAARTVTASFLFTVLEAPFEFTIELRSTRAISTDPVVIGLQQENAQLRIRVQAAEKEAAALRESIASVEADTAQLIYRSRAVNKRAFKEEMDKFLRSYDELMAGTKTAAAQARRAADQIARLCYILRIQIQMNKETLR